ncbi:MAG: 30S ribosome-binding factor RbfA [Candidatus Hydrogenedens sp.]|nr:30S ribosome-binding factor RbfA [Candidatus Hydrogenedens sp.]
MSMQGRAHRVSELIREEVAKLLGKGIKDPRVGFVSVMGVRMSPDLHYANVYVSLYGTDKERKSSLIALRNASGWIRREIGKHLRMRVIPEVRFFEDDSLDEVYRLEQVFEAIHEEQEAAPMLHLNLEEFAAELRTADRFLVTSHENPDGDAAGSMLGMACLLRAMGKTQVHCALADPVPPLCRGLAGAKQVLRPSEDDKPEYDVAVVVDVAQHDRIGDVIDWIPAGTKVMVLDHHRVEHPWGTSGLLDATYAAVGEMVVEVFNAAGIPLTREAAECCYVAQITDTGSFQYSNTNPRSHRIAAQMLEAGIDAAKIAQEAFALMSRTRFSLFQRGVSRIEFQCGGRVAWSYATTEDLEEFNAGRPDLEGLVNYCRNIEGVAAGVFFTALEPQLTKVSLRTAEGFNAADIAKHFGGGGHAAAAGITFQAGLDEARAQLLARLTEVLGENA